ncbi:MAG: DUF2239 family protein [Capsulimonadaceae bacterium]
MTDPTDDNGQGEAFPTFIAFNGDKRLALGDLSGVAGRVKQVVDADPEASVLVFNATSSMRVELDLRGTLEDVLARVKPAPQPAESPAGPGRPRLGVVSREVTLLPRHWDWLNRQPGGASVALRKLVEEARRANSDRDRKREALESTYRFLQATSGDRPGFEEATRALFAGNLDRFAAMIDGWPHDIREHATNLAALALI